MLAQRSASWSPRAWIRTVCARGRGGAVNHKSTHSQRFRCLPRDLQRAILDLPEPPAARGTAMKTQRILREVVPIICIALVATLNAQSQSEQEDCRCSGSLSRPKTFELNCGGDSFIWPIENEDCDIHMGSWTENYSSTLCLLPFSRTCRQRGNDKLVQYL